MKRRNRENLILQILKKGEDRDIRLKPGVYCHCGKNTKKGKPVCVNHIMEMPYAQWVQDNYIDPFMGARKLREICPPEDLWKLEYYKEFE